MIKYKNKNYEVVNNKSVSTLKAMLGKCQYLLGRFDLELRAKDKKIFKFGFHEPITEAGLLKNPISNYPIMDGDIKVSEQEQQNFFYDYIKAVCKLYGDGKVSQKSLYTDLSNFCEILEMLLGEPVRFEADEYLKFVQDELSQDIVIKTDDEYLTYTQALFLLLKLPRINQNVEDYLCADMNGHKLPGKDQSLYHPFFDPNQPEDYNPRISDYEQPKKCGIDYDIRWVLINTDEYKKIYQKWWENPTTREYISTKDFLDWACEYGFLEELGTRTLKEKIAKELHKLLIEENHIPDCNFHSRWQWQSTDKLLAFLCYKLVDKDYMEYREHWKTLAAYIKQKGQQPLRKVASEMNLFTELKPNSRSEPSIEPPDDHQRIIKIVKSLQDD